MKIDFKPSRGVTAALKALGYSVFVVAFYWGIHGIFKIPMSMDGCIITLVTSSMFLHFYNKED